MKNAELTPTAQKMDKLVKRIEESDIKIPEFQRGFIWKQNQVIDLLESIENEYPIGSILLWSSMEKLKSTRNIAGYEIPERDDSYPVNYVLDGQQRLASIYGVFGQNAKQENDDGNYNPNLDIFEIYYDFEKNLFLPKDDIDINSSAIIYLRHLFDLEKLIAALSTLDDVFHKSANNLMSQFLNYEIPIVTITNRDKSDVSLIFERINNTGTRLSMLDLMTAWTWTENFHLKDATNCLLDELDAKGFGELKPKIIIQVVSAIIQNTTRTNYILDLKGEQVRDNWERISEALRMAIDFLATDLKCEHLDFLPFPQQIICLAKFFSEIDAPKADQISLLRKWFWKTSFSKRYSSGQTNARMDEDINAIVELNKGNTYLFEPYHYDVTEAMLKSTKFSKANSLTRAFLLLMAQFKPVDLVKNVGIDLSAALSKYNRKEYHHVFPQAFLKKRDVPQGKIFCAINFCFLSSDSNKMISSKEPSDYFFSVISNDDYQRVLNSNLLPIAKKIYKDNDYDEFLEKRASLIIDSIDKLTT